MSVAYRLWLPFLINRVLNLTILRSVIYDQSVDSSRFAQMKILKDQSVQTTSRVVRIAYRLWLPFLVKYR